MVAFKFIFAIISRLFGVFDLFKWPPDDCYDGLCSLWWLLWFGTIMKCCCYHKRDSNLMKLHDLVGQFIFFECGMSLSPNRSGRISNMAWGVCYVAPFCWNHMLLVYRSFNLGQKKVDKNGLNVFAVDSFDLVNIVLTGIANLKFLQNMSVFPVTLDTFECHVNCKHSKLVC